MVNLRTLSKMESSKFSVIWERAWNAVVHLRILFKMEANKFSGLICCKSFEGTVLHTEATDWERWQTNLKKQEHDDYMMGDRDAAAVLWKSVFVAIIWIAVLLDCVPLGKETSHSNLEDKWLYPGYPWAFQCCQHPCIYFGFETYYSITNHWLAPIGS